MPHDSARTTLRRVQARLAVATALAAMALLVAPGASHARDTAALGSPAPAAPLRGSRPPERREKSAAFVVNPIAMILGIINVDVGIGIHESVSVNVAPQLIRGFGVSGWGANVGLQLFPGEELYDGWFFFPFGGHARASADATDVTVRVWAAGCLIGRHWSWDTFSLRLGGVVTYYAAESRGGLDDTRLSGVQPGIDLSLGAAF